MAISFSQAKNIIGLRNVNDCCIAFWFTSVYHQRCDPQPVTYYFYILINAQSTASYLNDCLAISTQALPLVSKTALYSLYLFTFSSKSITVLVDELWSMPRCQFRCKPFKKTALWGLTIIVRSPTNIFLELQSISLPPNLFDPSFTSPQQNPQQPFAAEHP